MQIDRQYVVNKILPAIHGTICDNEKQIIISQLIDSIKEDINKSWYKHSFLNKTLLQAVKGEGKKNFDFDELENM